MSKTATRILAIGLTILLIVNAISVAYLFVAIDDINDRVETIEEENENITDYLLHGGEQSTVDGNAPHVERSSGYFVAYDSHEDSGVMFAYEYQPLPGDSIYVDASRVTVESSFQESLRDAQAAVKETDYEPQTYGMAISLETPEAWEFVRGESAGLAVAAQIAATDPNYELNESVVLTGQVGENGNVVSVNHVGPKGDAAGEQGKELLIAPHSYGATEAENIEVVHVQSIEEALEYALDPVDDTDRDDTDTDD